jgi:ADP-ribose pyrophosphatase YjhB (NUDIX family)
VLDGRGRLLVIRRGQAPSAGLWSVPGGRCRPDEAPDDACVREVAEETGVAVRVLRLAGQVERDAPDGDVYVIDDFVCALAGGPAAAPVAGDDADDARWVTRAELAALELVPGLWDCLVGWGVLPA